MHAFILAGGLGTRLRPFSLSLPKPLLPLSDRPIIEIIFEQLQKLGFVNVTLSLGYMAPLFQAFVGDGSRWGLNVDYVLEDEPLGTAGALRLAENMPENFLVINGDTLTDLNFAEMLDSHARSSAIATIFAAEVKETVDYGVVEFDSSGLLAEYFEKPVRNYFVSTGVYALSSRIVQYDPCDGKLDMPDLLKSAIGAGEQIYCYRQKDAYWRDIGRFDHFEAASKDFEKMRDQFLHTKLT